MASVFKRGGKRNRSGKYYISWHDHTGKRRSKCSGTTDKAAAERIARKYESDAALRRDGVIDPTLDALKGEMQRTIDSHLVDYQHKLRTANRTQAHIDGTAKYVRWIATGSPSDSNRSPTTDGVIAA